MAVTIAIETPLQDDVRELVGQLNDLPACRCRRWEFQFKMTVEQMADAERRRCSWRGTRPAGRRHGRAHGDTAGNGRGEADVHAARGARPARRLGAARGDRGAGAAEGA